MHAPPRPGRRRPRPVLLHPDACSASAAPRCQHWAAKAGCGARPAPQVTQVGRGGPRRVTKWRSSPHAGSIMDPLRRCEDVQRDVEKCAGFASSFQAHGLEVAPHAVTVLGGGGVAVFRGRAGGSGSGHTSSGCSPGPTAAPGTGGRRGPAWDVGEDAGRGRGSPPVPRQPAPPRRRRTRPWPPRRACRGGHGRTNLSGSISPGCGAGG